VENLQKAVESNASTVQVKEAVAKLREARKQKQADLVKAQEELRKVLTTRQEAKLILAGMLD
jgi:Spy/CpxP family protein refolding chaperone